MLAAAALLLPALTSRPTAHDSITTRVTFDREIRAILDARCGACHSSRGSAPIPFTTYEEVRPWARAIKEQVLSRRMPKWHAARGFGAFTDDPSLTPLETALIVSWVDGGLPRSATVAPSTAPAASAAPSSAPVASAFRRKIDAFRLQSNLAITVRAKADAGVATLSAKADAPSVTAAWIAGWSFEPGDPLITSARISSASGPIATWVAGDPPVTLAAGYAIRATGTLRVELQRRAPADYESSYTARRSVLRLVTGSERPARRAVVEEAQCGVPPSRSATVLAIRPLLDRGGSARLWLQRPGAPASVLGWFREFDPSFARSYWLARPVDLTPDARIQSDTPCRVELTLAR